MASVGAWVGVRVGVRRVSQPTSASASDHQAQCNFRMRHTLKAHLQQTPPAAPGHDAGSPQRQPHGDDAEQQPDAGADDGAADRDLFVPLGEGL